MNMTKAETERCEEHREETRMIMIKLAKLEIWIKIAAAAAGASVLGGKLSADTLASIAAGMN